MEKNSRPVDRIWELSKWLVDKRVLKSRAAFERLCGFSDRYIKNLYYTENGNPGVDTIASIYKIFPAVSLEWLVAGENDMMGGMNEDEFLSEMRNSVSKFDVNNNVRKAMKSKVISNLTMEERLALIEELKKK